VCSEEDDGLLSVRGGHTDPTRPVRRVKGFIIAAPDENVAQCPLVDRVRSEKRPGGRVRRC